MIGYKKDDQDNIVVSKLNESALSQLAVLGDGKYFRLTGSREQIKELKNEIEKIEAMVYGKVSYDHYVSYYQLPLLIALILLFIELLLSDRKTRLKWLQV